jgi:holliday junction DNA helicase RuvA
MIAFISGKLIKKTTETIIVDCRGVGYEIIVPSKYLLSNSLTEGEPITIDTYLHVKEDLLELYGFENIIQKQVFMYLIKVSGISCKSAIKILSTFSTEEIILAIKEGNTKKLRAAPGLGKKTAEKVILELKDKFLKVFTNVYETKKDKTPELSSNVLDAMEGLITLGFTQSEVKNVMASLDKGMLKKNANEIIKECLSKLSSV